MKKEDKKFVNDLKVRTIFPFYIDNINPDFFDSITKYKNKSFNRKITSKLNTLKLEELKKIKEFEDISSHNTLLLLINRTLKRIVSKTGTDKCNLFIAKNFDKNNEPFYVEEKNEIYDLDVIGNVQKDRRYIYAIDLNPKSYLFNYVEQIQFSFYLDEKNKMVSGGVSWNWGNDNKPTNQEDVIEKVYITSLIKYYLTREINDISLNNIISILDNAEDVISNKNKKSTKRKANKTNNINLESLRNSWKELIDKKILQKNKLSSFNAKYLMDELFYSLLITLMISLTIFEELKIYFRHQEPKIYNPLLKRSLVLQNNDNQNYMEDFFELISFLKKNYYNAEKTNLKKILLDADDAIEALIKFDKRQNLYFGEPLLSYEIIRNSDIPFLDEDDDVFMNSNELKTLFMMTMDPHIFGIHQTNHNFLNYHDLKVMLKKINYNQENWKDVLEQKIDLTICEWNYDYVSFINQDLTCLIVKNDNPVDIKTKKSNYEYDANRKLFNNYLWSQIYAHAIIYKIKDLELKFNTNKVKYPQLLRGYIYEVKQLSFDWYDDFYGLSQIKKIVKKIDDFKNINKSVDLLVKKMNREDKLYGKSKERLNISFAFIAASLFGITDFLTMVFTVLTVQDTSKGLSTENLVTIGVGCLISFIMFLILSFTVISPIIKRRKLKKEE